jgi:type IV secretory pathway VirB2 component (pilin)
MLQEEKMNKQTLSVLGLVLLLSFMALQFAAAVDFNQPISATDKATFDQILQPVMKIYNLVKYVATALAVVVLLFAGIIYITSGSDPAKREQAKNMAMYVVIGLIVIWAAPLVVNFIVG